MVDERKEVVMGQGTIKDATIFMTPNGFKWVMQNKSPFQDVAIGRLATLPNYPWTPPINTLNPPQYQDSKYYMMGAAPQQTYKTAWDCPTCRVEDEVRSDLNLN